MPLPDDRPRIALTLGDVAGTGPELVARVLVDPGVKTICRPVAVGPVRVLERALALVGVGSTVRVAGSFAELAAVEESSGSIVCVDPTDGTLDDVAPGRIDARCGQAAYDALVSSVDAALAGKIDAITTAPLNKAALHAAGIRHPGHTEILAERCGRESFAMMLYLPPGDAVQGPHGFGVAHVTLHTSIRSVPDLITHTAVRGKIDLVEEFLTSLGCDRPRIGVCALNPHAGEGGLFGDEEGRIIEPAVEEAVAAGTDVTGPLPADTLMMRAAAGAFDGVVAMYHDQGHVALKLLDFDRAVNVTLGLPIVRTSASQGTAFDIAWQGRARPEGMLSAVRVAARLASFA